MKFLNIFFVLFLSLCSREVLANDADKTITVTITLSNCQGDSLSVYQFDGIVFNRVQILRASLTERGQYKLVVPKGKNDFFFIGQTAQDMKPLILGTEENVSLDGNCYSLRSLTVKNSKLIPQYDVAMRRLGELIAEGESAFRSHQSAGGDAARLQAAELELSTVDRKKSQFLDSLRKTQPYMAKIVAPGILYSYPINGKAKYGTEQEFFAKEYFSQVDFKDEDYNRLPTTFEAFKNYTNTIHQITSFSAQQQRDYVESWLSKFPKSSRAYKMALGGIVTSLMSRNHINYIEFGERYVAMYAGEEPGVTTQLNNMIRSAKTFITGVEAPDFSQNTPEDKPLALSALRGKLVLIDFWASWCGPCRRENPSVVALYNKYKERGFDVMSVSLDSDKNRWMEAIAKDGLLWSNHISDLKGWQNAVAGLYSVTSIPQTLLIDKNGKIIARNLRGEQLSEQLKSILGE